MLIQIVEINEKFFNNKKKKLKVEFIFNFKYYNNKKTIFN